MTTIDLSPLYRSSIGFDRMGSLLDSDVVKLFNTPQLSGILHFQTLFFIIVRADITQRRM